MTAQQIKDARDRFIAQHGPWTGHRIHLGEGVYTCEDVPQYCLTQRMAAQRAAMGTFEVENQYVLDLGCLEGAFSIDFAQRGAFVIGIDARPENIHRAQFARDILQLSTCKFAVHDVRKLSTLGPFDFVLCAGILYHLTADDAFSVLQQIKASGARLVLVETHVAPTMDTPNPFNLSLPEKVKIDGASYGGRWYPEFPFGLTDKQKLEWSTGSAKDNDRSFWFFPEDLIRLLQRVGFQVEEATRGTDTILLVARQ